MSEIFFLEAEYDYNFEIYALNCTLKEYHLAWLLNKNLFLNLIKKNDLTLSKDENENYNFSCFEFFAGIRAFRLIKNASYDEKPNFFVKDLLGYDYLFLVKDPTGEINEKKMTLKLRKMQGILRAEKFNPLHIKEKEFLVFE
jgi:hypothetical protein